MKPCLVYLAATLAGAAPAPGAVVPASNTVAVADFELAGDQPEARDWAFGLADVLAVELQQRGVVLFERQQIRVVLGERRITASGLMELRANPAQDIPDLQYLVTGSIRPIKTGQFHLEVSLVEARTGRNTASFDREGRYPEDVPGALATLADQIANRLKSAAQAAGPQREAGYRPARAPEASLLFYKGVAYCLAGQPELGVSWFIDTVQAAPNFLPARLWTLRAFEMIGLPEFAEVARAKVRAAPNGQGVLNRLNESPFLDKKLVSVAVIPDLRLDAAGWQLATALKTALGHYTNLFVADPSNIRSLAAEMDLQLTEKGGHELELGSVLWSAVDALVLVSAEPAATNAFSVELHDAATGSTLFRSEARAGTTGLDKLSLAIVEHITANRKTALNPASGELTRRTGAVKPAQVVNTDRNEFAGLLKYLSENPSDRGAWMRIALFMPWLNGAYCRACFDQVLAATDPGEPDAAHWISEAIWHKRSYEGSSRGDGILPSIAVEASALFERYPESLEAQYARSALGLEYFDQKKYAEAAQVFLKLANELPRLAKQVDIGPSYWANFYFFTAAALHETGDDARARQFLTQADEVLQKNPNLIIYDGDTFQLGVWVNHFPVAHPLFGTEKNLWQAVAEWRERLSPAPASDGRKTLTLDQIEATLKGARQRQMAGTESETRFYEFVRQLAEHKRLHPDLYRGRITDQDQREPWRQIWIWNGTTAGNYTLLGKFMIEAPGILQHLASAANTTNKRAEVRSLGYVLADNLEPGIAANFYEATGDYDFALQKVGEAVGAASPSPATQSLRQQKIRLLQTLGRKQEAAVYARSQVPSLAGKPPLDVCLDAADAAVAVGRGEEAIRMFSEIVRATGPVEKMDSYGATMRLTLADYEAAQGNLFEASELLRLVARQSEGKQWGAYLRTGYTDAHSAAVSRLSSIRLRSKFPVLSTDWEHPPRPPTGALEPEDPEPSEMKRDLDALLRGTRTGPNSGSYGGAQVGAFIKKYGHAAVPAILKAAAPGGFPAHLIVTFKLLDQLATPEDASLVLAAFKTAPELAPIAFRLDRTNADVILGERFAIYAKGGEIPRELLAVLEKYRLRDQYPVLLANLAAKELNGNTAPNAAAVDRILQHGAAPELIESFRAVLASILEKEMLMSYRYGLAGLSETALRNGVPQGIEAALRSESPPSTNCLVCLRKYIDLPTDDAKALAMVQSNLGHWRWEAGTRKFVLGRERGARRVSARMPDKGP